MFEMLFQAALSVAGTLITTLVLGGGILSKRKAESINEQVDLYRNLSKSEDGGADDAIISDSVEKGLKTSIEYQVNSLIVLNKLMSEFSRMLVASVILSSMIFIMLRRLGLSQSHSILTAAMVSLVFGVTIGIVLVSIPTIIESTSIIMKWFSSIFARIFRCKKRNN